MKVGGVGRGHFVYRVGGVQKPGRGSLHTEVEGVQSQLRRGHLTLRLGGGQFVQQLII